MFGKGIVKGLSITMRYFFSKKVTVQYPDVKRELPKRSMGSFNFDKDKCIACGICADACANRVIRVDTTKDEKGRKVLQNYHMNLGYCLFCGLCVRACPKEAITFKTDFDMCCYNKVDTIYDWKGNEIKKNVVVLESADNNNLQKGEVG